MKNVLLVFLSLLWFTSFIYAQDDVEVVLQNGLNGYDGCEDSYITTTNWSSIQNYQKNLNHSTKTDLIVHNEAC